MAFEFFRRRQKMVIIIMVVLMVSFLVGVYGFQSFFAKDPGKQVLYTTRYGDLTRHDLIAADAAINVLTRLQRFVPHAQEFGMLVSGQQPDLVFALLLQEAHGTGVRISDLEMDQYWAQLKEVGFEPEKVGLDKKSLDSAVRSWLTVQRAAALARMVPPPSDSELRQTYADIGERVDVQHVRFNAVKYLDKVQTPTPQQVRDHFLKYRAEMAGAVSGTNPFGFGYKLAPAVKVAYLLLEQEPIEQVVRPSDNEVRAYYRSHKSEFPTTSGADYSADTIAEIRQALASSAAQRRMDQMVSSVQAAVEAAGRDGAATRPGVSVYDAVVERMVQPADSVLASTVTVKIDAMPLQDALARLAEAAGQKAIVYPMGASDGLHISPAVKVSLPQEPMKLSEALARITAQVLGVAQAASAPASQPSSAPVSYEQAAAAFKWRTFKELPEVLFATAGAEKVNTLPLKAGQTGWMTRQDLIADDLLGQTSSTPTGGDSLAQLAFNSTALAGTSTDSSDKLYRLSVGQEARRLFVHGGDRLLWRLVDVRQQQEPVPDAIDKDKQLYSRVAADVRLQMAYELAVKTAQDFAAQARQAGLEAAAAKEGLKTDTTGQFSRMSFGMKGLEWNDIKGLSLSSDEARQDLIKRMFALRPANVEPPYTFPQTQAEVVPVPSRTEVLVARLADYKPVVESEYQGYKPMLDQNIMMMGYFRGARSWYGLEDVKTRLEVKVK
jgi:hypothetical protein